MYEVSGPTSRIVDHLIESLKDRRWNRRRYACGNLGDIGDRRAVEPLIELLKDIDQVQICSVEALGKIGDKRAVKPLIELLNNGDNFVRKYVANALGYIGDERAVEPLIELLNNGSPRERTCAANALHQIGGERAIKALEKDLEGK